MGAISDAIQAMKEVVLLNDKVERVSNDTEKLAESMLDHEKRLIKIETLVEVAKYNKYSQNKITDES